jgi:hypothetical protein
MDRGEMEKEMERGVRGGGGGGGKRKRGQIIRESRERVEDEVVRRQCVITALCSHS